MAALLDRLLARRSDPQPADPPRRRPAAAPTEAEKAGAAAQAAADAVVARAAVQAPNTADEVATRMKRGTF